MLDQRPASGHVLVALVWEAGGVAAGALADVGLAKGSEREVRRWLSEAPESERGMGVDAVLSVAARQASALGHGYVGTEHQLLASAGDDRLGEGLLDAVARNRARERVLEITAEP